MPGSSSTKTIRLQTFKNPAAGESYPATETEQRRPERSSSQVGHLLTSWGETHLTTGRTGVADEQLERIERDRKRKSHVDGLTHGTNKRSRSVSSHSSSSVSTISTNLSRSPSPKQATSHHKAYQTHDTANGTGRYKTRRSRDSSMSYSSEASFKRHRRAGSSDRDHAFPAKLGSASGLRGERNDNTSLGNTVASTRKRRRSYSSSMSYTSDSSFSGRQRSKPIDNVRRTRPRRSTVSPDTRGRDRWSRAPRSSRRTPSRSNSMDRSQVARERRSMTPVRASRGDGNEPARAGRGKKEVVDARFGSDNDRYGSSFRNREYDDRGAERPKPAPPPRKQRSLSPFSKRVALTQAMNMGR
ncbi:MAG: hypothetical protein Q9171_000668 [Xanthocarpia ochracea]